MPKLILNISMSLDGYIAGDDDDLSFLAAVQAEGEDYGYSDFTSQVDAYIVGKKTYDVVMNLTDGKFPQAKLFDCYVITRQDIENSNGVTFYNGDINTLITDIKNKGGKHIYCDGGGQIVKLLLDNQLIDEYIISIIPTILGNGKRLFIGNSPPNSIEFVEAKTYKTGLVQLRYKRK
ncbi:MAG: dihydrofolate reductase [Bacteroidia bacterium]